MRHTLILIAALVAPVTIGLVAYARALRPVRDGGPPAFFAIAQQAPWIALLGILAWAPAAFRWLGPVLSAQALPLPLHVPALGLLLLGPPIATWCALGLLVHDVARAAGLTEWTWRDAIGEAVGSLVGALVLIALMLAAVGAAQAAMFREAALATIAGVLWGAMVIARQNRKSGLTPHAVTSGELRDRVFALAQRAGVKLTQLYVVPFRRFRLPNAFAVQGNLVTLTDLLLREVDRDEVDAILAHEMAHLARRDPDRLALIAGLALAIPIALAMSGVYAAAIVLLPLSLVGVLAYQRRMEYATDAKALTLGIRAESLITGLLRLHQVSQVPVRWSRLRGWFVTHPSLVLRAQRIAQLAQLDPRAVESLLGAPPAPGPRYAVPTSIDTPRVFGSEFRRRMIARLSWTSLAVTAAVPALVIAALGPFGPVPRVLGLALAVLAGCAAWLLWWAFSTAASMRGLERSLATRLGGASGDSRTFVGLAPSPTPRAYEGFSVWDAGFLAIGRGRIEYRGEEAVFALAPDQVRELAMDDGLPGWIRIPGIRVSWMLADGTSGVFRLVSLGGGSAFEAHANARRLLASLAAWRSATGGASLGSTLGHPPTMEVTSASPRDLLPARAIISTLIVLGVLSLGAAFLIGLPLHPLVPGWLDASVASTIAFLLALAPALTWREPAGVETQAREHRRAA